MKRGRLKTVTLPIPVDEISSDVQRTLDGELEWGLSVTDRGRTASGRAYAKGRAALRKEVERDVARVKGDDGDVFIDATVQHDHVTQFGEWIAVDEGWIAVSDEWVAGNLATQISGYPEDAHFVLQGLLESVDATDVWQLGFSGRGVADGGSKGVLYGHDVHEDPDLGEELRHTPLNELGIEHPYEGIPVKSYFAAGTGYVEVYDSEFTTAQFVDYCSRHVVQHIERDDWALYHSNRSSSAGEEADVDDDGEPRKCENCPQESESVQKTLVDDEIVWLCVTCRDYYLEKGEVPA